jgi:arabinofuranan 3-O-arabinosyltransferase
MRSLNALGSNPQRLRLPPFSSVAAATERSAAVLARPRNAAAALTLVSAIAAQSWFRFGRVIATGDNFPSAFIAPDNTLERARAIWGFTVTPTGAVDFFSTLEAIPALFAKVVEAVGGSPALAQRGFLTLLFAAIAPSMFLLLRTLLPRPECVLGAAAGAFFYAFNPIVFFAVPSMVLLLALSLIPLLAALVVRGVRESSWPYPIMLAGASLPLSYVFLNPPTFVLVCATAAAALVVAAWRERQWAAAGRLFVRTLPLVAIVNLWWIVPAIVFYGRRPTVTPAANVASWNWTHAHASIPNVLRLVPTWSWPQPEYFPYAVTLERPGLVALAFLPAGVTVGALLTTRGAERRLAAWVVGVLAGATVLAKGLHPPLSSLNRAIYHLPGMWLYREPATKFGMVVAGTLAAGIAVFVSSFPSRRGRRSAAVAVLGAATIVSYPLWLGQVVPDNRPQLGPEHIQIPAHWYELARYLGRDRGRTLVLPADDYYQVPYRWGYYGDDSLPKTMIRSSVVIPPDPQPPAAGFGYFEPDPGAARMTADLRRALSAGAIVDAARLARALGIRWVVVRGDVDAEFPGRRILDPAALSGELSGSPGFRRVRKFGALDLFEVRAPHEAVWATRSAVVLRSGGAPGAALAIAPAFTTADTGTKLRSPRLTELPAHRQRPLLTLPTTENERESLAVVSRWPRGIAATLVAQRHSVSVVLPTLTAEGRELASLGVGTELPLGHRTAKRFFGLDGRVVVSEADGRASIILAGGAHRLITYARAEKNVIGDGSFESGTWTLGNCNASGRPARATMIRAQRVPVGVDGRFALRLSARRDTACASTPLRTIDPSSLYRISLAYRKGLGAPPRLCLWEQEPGRCAPLVRLAAHETWTRSTDLFRLDPATRHASVYLYADASSAPAAVLYDAVRVERFVPERSAAFTVRPAGSWHLTHLAPAERSPLRLYLESRGALLDSVRVEGIWSRVSDCARADRRRPAQVGIRALPTRAAGRDVLALQARAHSACVHARVRAFDPAATYQLSLDYRRISGAAPRLCVWESGPDQCAALPALDERSGWHRITWSFRADPGTRRLDVYVYADGVSSGTQILYRRLGVTRLPAAPEVAVAASSPPTHGAPRVSSERKSEGTEYNVQVHGATEPYLLVLNETYERGWRLSGADGARHIRVNGYANGWVVDRTGSYSLTLSYAPQRVVTLARGFSFGGVAAGLLALGALSLRRWRRRDTGPCSR